MRSFLSQSNKVMSLQDAELELAYKNLPNAIQKNLGKACFGSVQYKRRTMFLNDPSAFFTAYLPDMLRYALAQTHPELFDASKPSKNFEITVLTLCLKKGKIVCTVKLNEEFVIKFGSDKCCFDEEVFMMQKLKEELEKEENRAIAKHFCVWQGHVTVPTDYGKFYCSCMQCYPNVLPFRFSPRAAMPYEVFLRNLQAVGKIFDFFDRTGMWHLDSFPRNIALDSEDNFVIIDWDLSCYTVPCDEEFKEYARKVQYESFYIAMYQCYVEYTDKSTLLFNELMCNNIPMKDAEGQDRREDKLKWGRRLDRKPFMESRRFNNVEYRNLMCCDLHCAGYIAHGKNVLFTMQMCDDKEFWAEHQLFEHQCKKEVKEMFSKISTFPEETCGRKRKAEKPAYVPSREY